MTPPTEAAALQVNDAKKLKDKTDKKFFNALAGIIGYGVTPEQVEKRFAELSEKP